MSSPWATPQRGGISVDVVLNEVLLSPASTAAPCHHPRGYGGSALLVLPEAVRVWAALGAVLRAQILLGRPVCLGGAFAWWTDARPVAREGGILYRARDVSWGLTPSFTTRYSLASGGLPRMVPTVKPHAVPIDLVVAESGLVGVAPSTVAALLRDVVAFIGEGLFRGKSFALTWEGLMSIHIDRDRAKAVVDRALGAQLFALSSRKWPSAVRDAAAAAAVVPPVPSRVGTPAAHAAAPARSPRIGTAQADDPNAAAVDGDDANAPPGMKKRALRPEALLLPPSGVLDTPRPAFVSAAPGGKLFCDGSARRPRTPTPTAAAASASARTRRRSASRGRPSTPTAAVATPVAVLPRGESVYGILPREHPQRRGAPQRSVPCPPARQATTTDALVVRSTSTGGNDGEHDDFVSALDIAAATEGGPLGDVDAGATAAAAAAAAAAAIDTPRPIFRGTDGGAPSIASTPPPPAARATATPRTDPHRTRGFEPWSRDTTEKATGRKRFGGRETDSVGLLFDNMP